MEDATGYEEAPSGPAAILEAVKKFGIGKLLIVLIILGAALWFFVLAPKPGSLTLKVVEIDSGEKIENVQVDLGGAGQKTVTKFTSGSGSVSFNDVPAATELTLDVSAPPGYEIAGDLESPLTLKSGESKSISVTMAQDVDLAIEASVDQIALGTECQSVVPVSVRNNGNDAFNVQLIGEGALKGLVESEAQRVAPQSQQTFQVNVTSPSKKGTASGKIRAQFTDASDSFAIEATDPEQLRVSPSSYSERVQPGAAIKKQFTIENNGRSGEARDIRVSLAGDFGPLGAQITLSDELPLKPKQTKIMTLEFNAPTFAGKSVGVLIVSSACQRIQIPLELNVLEPRS